MSCVLRRQSYSEVGLLEVRKPYVTVWVNKGKFRGRSGVWGGRWAKTKRSTAAVQTTAAAVPV